MNSFDEQYFKTINYTNYLDREHRYIKLANELFTYLKTIKFITDTTTFIDYGAGVGFLTNSIRKMGYACDSYDISEWAIKYGYEKYGIEYISYQHKKYDVMIALDVFEHMTDTQIVDVFNTFKSDYLIIRIPCSSNGIDFHLDVSKKDPTHINCKTKLEWQSFFIKNDFNQIQTLNLYTVFDSEGVMCSIFKKQQQ